MANLQGEKQLITEYNKLQGGNSNSASCHPVGDRFLITAMSCLFLLHIPSIRYLPFQVKGKLELTCKGLLNSLLDVPVAETAHLSELLIYSVFD